MSLLLFCISVSYVVLVITLVDCLIVQIYDIFTICGILFQKFAFFYWN